MPLATLFHFLCTASSCNTDTTQDQRHKISNTQRTENKTTNVVIQQHSSKPLMMDILMSETCWVHKKWNKIASDIKLVFYSWTITMMHSPINIRFYEIVHLCIFRMFAVMELPNAIKYIKIIMYSNTNLVYLRALVGAIIVHIINVAFFRICTTFYMQNIGTLTGPILIRNEFYGTNTHQLPTREHANPIHCRVCTYNGSKRINKYTVKYIDT